MISVKLIGATGYGGLGLIEILRDHPELRIAAVAATQDVGKPVSSVWPYLEGWFDMVLQAPDDPEFQAMPADAVVCATPDGVGQIHAPAALAAGAKVLDYSGDYRFDSAELYAEYARRIGREAEHRAPELLPRAVYGLTEINRQAVAGASLVGNPGCFAMSCTLGLYPAVREKLVETNGIVCDAKTGVSGAGKKPSPGHHYPERYDSMGAYRLSGHQHVMEIEEMLSRAAGVPVRVTFTAQIVPVCRGILSTLYGRMSPGTTQEKVLDAYRAFYRDDPFIRVKGPSEPADTGLVRGSNRCVLSVACDERTGTFRVVSHIDNLLKGQAGSAVQNLNVMFGLPETMGLDRPGAHP